MGFFGKMFKKKDDFDLGAPPDFSQPPGQQGNDPLANPNPYGTDPLQSQSPFDNYGGDQNATSQNTGSTFEHDIFSSNQPTNADRARDYAASFSPSPAKPGASGNQTNVTYGGAISGHEAQLILERLDTIKAELDAIKQRLMHVERYMESAEQKAGQRKYF